MRSALARTVTTIVALCVLLLSSGGIGGVVGVLRFVGVPPAITVDASFPCAGHGCGCRDAEMCRTSCCCFPRADACCDSEEVAPSTGDSCCEAESASETPPSSLPVLRLGGCAGESPAVAHRLPAFVPTLPSSIVRSVGRPLPSLRPSSERVPAGRSLAPPDKVPIGPARSDRALRVIV